jgi:hypothetical protein
MADDFRPGMNIGVHHANVAAVDRDCDEARALVGKFLPHTRMSGRRSEPRSHAWYRVEGDAPFLQLKGTTGKMIVELRYGHGKQTLVPPSRNPDHNDEPYVTYNEDTSVATVSAEELERGVRLTAACALIAQCYPESGGRHDFGLHLAGFLLRNGEDEQTVYDLMLAARELIGPLGRKTETTIRKAVSSTARKLEEGAEVTGGPRLKEEYDERLPSKLATALGWQKTDWSEGGSSRGDDRRNQADRLVQYALDAGVPLFVDQFQAPHTLVDGEALSLTSRSYNWLRGLIWKHEGRSVNGEALKTAAGTLAAFADASGDVRELYTRAAYSGGALYYQLGKGRVVQVDKEGWRLVADPPVVFRSIPNLKPLPDPERGGGFEALDALVNLKSDRDKRLFRAYAVTLPLEHVQRPILQPTGVMGSGKSTASRAVKRTLDPSAPEAVRFDPRDFIQKASHSFIVMLDNQNSLPEWAVDMLCRLVTGEADSKRKHYTDDDDINSQNRETLEGSGLAQAIFMIMEEHDHYAAPADKLLETLETEADKLKINIKRDKKWPGSPSWVYRRIREVLPLLNAAGITVERDRGKGSREITLSKGGAPTPPDDSRSESDDSIWGDTVTDAVIENPAKVSGMEEKGQNDDSSDSILGGFSPTLNARGDEPESAPEGSPTPPPREVPRNAVDAVVYGVTDEDDDEWEQF